MKSRTHPLPFILLIVLIFSLALAGRASAQDVQPTPSDNEVNAIAKQLFCPVCENTPLDVCPTVACAQWRELIREKLAAGWNKEQIKDYFVQQYGGRVLGSPPIEGFNWIIVIIPVVVILGGVYIVFRALQSWKTPLSATDANPIPELLAQDEYVKRLEEELKKS